ncbi:MULTISPECIES: flavin reductase family protein [Actinomadura]|jgi:flavin reductase ActVB|uniref:Flavin reductase family protein n=1 Tax=Actinomadura geliboluensis TaxID=882440 RepID=A0A5S4HAU8_9ACTN|nr:flavin reductase family protein [Actinomadura geliboluensis]TMR42378.1 flavin reductase family protein [Actinomadura geliboluensis]
MSVDVQDFKAALSRYLTGVTVVTTVDGAGRRWGFTATSFSSVSLVPPQILVCIARSAQCYEAFLDSPGFAVNVLNRGQEQVAERFAQRGGDKFAGLPFGTGSGDLPVLDHALAVFECGTRDRYPAGDHTILLGEVHRAEVGEGTPTLYYNRQFRPALWPDP